MTSTAPPELHTLPLHDALPIFGLAASGTPGGQAGTKPITLEAIQEFVDGLQGDRLGPRLPDHPGGHPGVRGGARALRRSEEHTSELQSQSNIVCRLLLEKKKNK